MRKAFTLIELLVVISIIALLIAILLPALGAARESVRKMQSSTQIRGIHQGFTIYAEGNKGFMPGMDTLSPNIDIATTDDNAVDTISGGGTRSGTRTTTRFAIALEDDLFTAEYAISPAETNADVQEWDENSTYDPTTDHITSYAASQLSTSSNDTAMGRASEWRNTSNSAAIVLGDRATEMGNFADPATYQSLWSDGKPNWSGSVLTNDNAVQFLFDREFEGTKYGSHTNTEPDNLFLGLNDKNFGVNGGTIDNNCDLAPGDGTQNTLEG